MSHPVAAAATLMALLALLALSPGAAARAGSPAAPWAVPQTPPEEQATGSAEARAAEAAVRATFEAYREALVAGDGETAAALVDRETERYYRDLRRLTVEGSAEEVAARRFVDRFLVVAFRHQFDHQELAALELGDVIVRAMDLGWINTAAIEQLALGDVRIEGGEAFGQARTRASLEDPALAGGLDEIEYGFVLEEGRWKFRFSALVASIDQVMRSLAAQLGADEDDLIFTLVESMSGVEVLPEEQKPDPR